MKQSQLLKRIIDALTQSLSVLEKAARAAHEEATHENQRRKIMLLTPQSPLGRNLMGKKAGQLWTTNLGGSAAKYHVLAVS